MIKDVAVHAMRRHAATRIARAHGVDAAASTLAHSSVITTAAHYVEKETVVHARGHAELGELARQLR
jgi:integrase